MKFLGIVLALAISTNAIKVKEEDKAKIKEKDAAKAEGWFDDILPSGPYY